MKHTNCDMFVQAEVSQLSLEDEFMRYWPSSTNQWVLKKQLIDAINSGINDFWFPKFDPSFNISQTEFYFEKGKMPAIGKSYNWWKAKAKEFMPERGSRLGTKKEYILFLGVFMKKLIANGWTVDKAWKTICDDASEWKRFFIIDNKNNKMERTGSREVLDFFDLSNVLKILDREAEIKGFWLAGGHYDNCEFIPLASMNYCMHQNIIPYNSVGWIILTEAV